MISRLFVVELTSLRMVNENHAHFVRNEREEEEGVFVMPGQ